MRILPFLSLPLFLVTGFAVAVGPSSGAVPEAAQPPGAVIVETLADDSEPWACCHPYTWECFLLTEEQCALIDGIWFPGASCDPNP